MPATYKVVDLFAGPGGLAEGFSRYQTPDGHAPFDVVLSVEKDPAAHRTLLLRSLLRQFEGPMPEYYDALNSGVPLPDWASICPGEWSDARHEAQCLELGSERARRIIDRRIDDVSDESEAVVIGGPPCQAYSIVGRVRNGGNSDYVASDDARHFLYREYIRVLRRLKPVAFVMENVKGMLSSSIKGDRIFDQVLADLRAAGGEPDSYRLYAVGRDPTGRMILTTATKSIDYVVRAEDHGIPQARHRVFIIGIRADRAKSLGRRLGALAQVPPPAVVRDILQAMPKLRSGLSAGDNERSWRQSATDQMSKVVAALVASGGGELAERAGACLAAFGSDGGTPPRSTDAPSPLGHDCPEPLASWIYDPLLRVTLNHASRGHMDDDLGRYFFSAVFTEATGRSPRAEEFPEEIRPAHANWSSGHFKDRFRTQAWDRPSTTVTSHISKDGHYFIHPDPLQCRALTVREAARLQTFPDNYLFLGNRTQQYIQVGNAVPPFLAHQIAQVLAASLAA